MAAHLREKYRADEKGEKYLSYYYAEFYDHQRQPRRKRISLQTRDKVGARQKFAQLERSYMAGLFDPWKDVLRKEGMTVKEAVDLFLKDRKQGRSAGTVASYRDPLRPLEKMLSPTFPLYAVETRHITAFMKKRDLAAASKKSYLDRFRIFFTWCEGQGLIKDNPMPPRVRGKQSRAHVLPEFLTEEQFEAIIRAAKADAVLKHLKHGNEPLIQMLRFAVGTGLRRGELCSLRWSAVDLKTGMLTVKNTEDFQTKSGRERSVPLVGGALTVVQQLQEARTNEGDGYVFSGTFGGQVNGNYLGKRFRYYRRKVGLPENINLHSLRHTFASWSVMRGMDLYRLKEIMGHADMKTTLVYAHLRPDTLRQEMLRCFGKDYVDPQVEAQTLRTKLKEKEAECEVLRRERDRLRDALGGKVEEGTSLYLVQEAGLIRPSSRLL